MRQLGRIRRRSLFKSGAAATAFAAYGLLPSGGFAQAKTQTVNLQLGWLAGNNQIGEVAAKALGFFEEEKLNLAIQPGEGFSGPSKIALGIWLSLLMTRMYAWLRSATSFSNTATRASSCLKRFSDSAIDTRSPASCELNLGLFETILY